MPLNPQGQLKIFKQGTVDLISDEELLTKLRDKKTLRIKYGADPSAPDLHLGHTVPLRKLRQLQDLGHQVVFVVGDFTARVGDPSGQSETRRTINQDEVSKNAETYEEQVFGILDWSKTEVRYNSEWLGKFKIEDFLTLMSKYTVARILERDDFAKRFADKRPITMLEFLYPLLQGYDSVQIKSDVELGGTDQKFNLLVGRELQRDWKQSPQIVMTLPLIEGTDGKDKMSKSLGDHIALKDKPEDMFGKVMSIPDHLTIKYFRYLTNVGEEKTNQKEAALKSGSLHPRDAKAELAREIVALYYDVKEAKHSEEQFNKMFREKELPDQIEEVAFFKSQLQNGGMDIVSLLKEAGLAASKSEARRLVEQGGVKVDQKRIGDAEAVISLKNPVVIQCGKRKFARIVMK